jgi:hypothetical protein
MTSIPLCTLCALGNGYLGTRAAAPGACRRYALPGDLPRLRLQPAAHVRCRPGHYGSVSRDPLAASMELRRRLWTCDRRFPDPLHASAAALHGEARFARHHEVRRAGLLGEQVSSSDGWAAAT